MTMDRILEKAFEWQRQQDEDVKELSEKIHTLSTQIETLQSLPQSSQQILDQVSKLTVQVETNTRALNERRGALDLGKWATSIIAALLSSALTGTIVMLIIQ